MSELGERLIQSLENAVQSPDGVQTHKISELRRIRSKLKMSVGEFANTFQLPKRTVEKWDINDAGLTSAVATLLKVIDKNPQAVIKALKT